MSIGEIVALALAGLAAGTINTIVGSGTLITFPVLLAFGYVPVTANVSNTIGLVPGSVSGAVGYRRELEGQGGRALRFGAMSVAGGITGAVLLLVLPASAFKAIVPAGDPRRGARAGSAAYERAEERALGTRQRRSRRVLHVRRTRRLGPGGDHRGRLDPRRPARRALRAAAAAAGAAGGDRRGGGVRDRTAAGGVNKPALWPRAKEVTPDMLLLCT
jgi:hypothetical protein